MKLVYIAVLSIPLIVVLIYRSWEPTEYYAIRARVDPVRAETKLVWAQVDSVGKLSQDADEKTKALIEEIRSETEKMDEWFEGRPASAEILSMVKEHQVWVERMDSLSLILEAGMK